MTTQRLTAVGDGMVDRYGRFLWPLDEELTPEAVKSFINYHKSVMLQNYDVQSDAYLGNHQILQGPRRKNRPDNRIMINLPKYIVESNTGYFMGIPPKIALPNATNNVKLQTWLDMNSFQDQLTELSKQTDIHGNGFMFLYQDENSDTRIAIASPEDAFMIYDDSIQHRPVAFVRPYYNTNQELRGEVYTKDYRFDLSDTMTFNAPTTDNANPFKAVPAVEFFENEERQGVLDNIISLNDALEKLLSQKSNQNEYFDNSYLKILGVQLPEKIDEKGNPIPGTVDLDILNNNVIYSPDTDATKGVIDFITKPDNDQMQEHEIDRLTGLIYKISMVANMDDEAFAGNVSGVALLYKLLPMKNMAATKERKFTQSLRRVFQLLFSVQTGMAAEDDWQALTFHFKRNLPINLDDEANTAKTLEGIVSKETQLSTLDIVDDPKAEIERMAKESNDAITQAQQQAESLTDQQQQSGDNPVES